MADRITIDISILQGIFGDLTKLQQQLSGVTGGVSAVDNAAAKAFGSMRSSVGGASAAVNALDNSVDVSMRNIVSDIMAPVAKAQELETKLRNLGDQVRTSKSVKEIVALKREITATQRELDGVSTNRMEGNVSSGLGRIRSMLSSMAAPLVGAFAIGGITSFVGGMVQAAGAQQKFSTAMNTMLGDKVKADAMIADVKKYAAATPFSTEEVQTAATQMLGMNFAAQEVIPTLQRLGDVAAGLGQPVGELTYLYSTAKTQGKLLTNDLMQFANRGIPIVDELSKVLGVSNAKVKELTEKGAVKFEHLQKVLENLTGEGSKFGGLTAAMGQTITGQLDQMSEAWQQFKADMGLAMAPLITGIIGGLSGSIDYLRDAFAWVQANGDGIVTVLGVVAGAVGIYTAALLVNRTATFANLVAQQGAAAVLGLTTMWTTLSTAAVNIATAAQWAWNAALSANPIGLVVIAVAALVAGVVWAWNTFEGFRGVVLGVWEVMKGAFTWLADFMAPVIEHLVMLWRGFGVAVSLAWDGFVAGMQVVGQWLTTAWGWISGFVDMVVGVWKQLATVLLQPFMKLFDMLATIPGVGKLIAKAREVGSQVGEAFSRGQEKGLASFSADAPTAKAKGSIDATDVAAPGQNVGAAALVGGPSSAGAKGKDEGVTVGGSSGSGRTITMDIKITNNITMPKDGNMGVRELADKVTAMLVTKLNDAQYAMG